MVIDAIIEHLEFVESFDNKTVKKYLTHEEIDYIKRFEFEYINSIFDSDKPFEVKNYELKKAFCKYIIENDYNLEIIPRILNVTWL